MPEIIHSLFVLVIVIILTFTGLIYWIFRPIQQPRFADYLSFNIEEGTPEKLFVEAEQKLPDISEEPLHQEGSVGGNNHQEIYRAFDAGKSLGEIAQSVNKNKGEVELILNLRKHWDQDNRTFFN